MRLHKLADLYADHGPFASVQIDVSRGTAHGAREVEIQAEDACDRLRADGAPKAVVAALPEVLTEPTGRPDPVSRAVVATERGLLLSEVMSVNTQQPTVTWGPLPDVLPWIEAVDGSMPFVLALVDHTGGSVAAYTSGSPQPDAVEELLGETEHVQKIRGGGMSHLRFQHTSENTWARNAEAVSTVVKTQVSAGIRLVIIAGDPRSRRTVVGELDNDPRVEIFELEHGGPAADGGDDALRSAIEDIIQAEVVAERLRTAEELRERLGRQEAVATGVRDVADAFVRGQVDRLLLDPAAARDLTLDPAQHAGLSFGAPAVDGPVRADLALVAAAVTSKAAVAVSPRRATAGSPVAALLRWDQ